MGFDPRLIRLALGVTEASQGLGVLRPIYFPRWAHTPGTKTMDDAIDRINQHMMRSAAAVEQYSGPEYLLAHERAALAELADEVGGRPVLGIGVGGGRTVNAVRALSED